MKPYTILSRINYPKDIKNLSNDELILLSSEIRDFIINGVSQTGGHLGANLGVVELTIALHKIFDTPKDKIIWDIGHQSYIHKILTGRKDLFNTLRQKNGISGFTKIDESKYDHFGAGHSSTSISAALGLSVAESLSGLNNKILAVIGDASITSGMALEAMNHAGSINSNLTVILNDNNKSILDNVGALNAYFSRITSSYSYSYIREHSKRLIDAIPFGMGKFIKDIEKYIRNISHNGFFEALGFFYIGPIDGHNFDHLLPILNNIKHHQSLNKPILLHIITKKGKGYSIAEQAKDNYHGVSQFDINTGKSIKNSNNKSYTNIFSDYIINLIERDEKVVAISAGTISGVGLEKSLRKFPNKVFDVGIAEQHAVTFAAGLAIGGYKAYVCLYSTFAQRAYDQIVHDVCIQKLPVRFILDRSGFVGEDGVTHHGLLNYNMYLGIPGIIFMAPSNENDFKSMLNIMENINDKPTFINFPKGILKERSSFSSFQFGKGEILKNGEKIAVIGVGDIVNQVMLASEQLENEGIKITVVDPKFLKPIDKDLFTNIFKNHQIVLVVEEGYKGGFSSAIHALYNDNYNINSNLLIHTLALEDIFYEQGSQEEQRKEANILYNSIYMKIKSYYN